MEERFFNSISEMEQGKARKLYDALTQPFDEAARKAKAQAEAEHKDKEQRRQMDAVLEAEARRDFERQQRLKAKVR